MILLNIIYNGIIISYLKKIYRNKINKEYSNKRIYEFVMWILFPLLLKLLMI